MRIERFMVLVCIFYLATGYISYTQKILYPVSDSVNARWDSFNIMDGKGGSVTTSLMQDSKGFIWAGNKAGLYRFDGKRYMRFGQGENNDSTLAGTAVISIFEDSEGTIWAGTYGALNRIDKRLNRIKYFFPDTTDPASNNNSVRLINEDSRGLLWLITDQNIFTFDKVSEKFTEYPIPRSVWHPITGIDDFEEDRYLEDNSGRIWIATDKGLYLFDHNDERWGKVFPGFREEAPGDTCRINCVEMDKAGNIWCGSEKYGLVRITDPSTGSYEKIPLTEKGKEARPDYEIGIIYIDTTNIIWAFGKGRLHKFNILTGEKSYFEFPEKIKLGSMNFNGML
ncbi:MAG: Histidine kinase [Bacteroidetes bacterium]|nr:Histidine kinase [Bacteroidota bacterium]